MLFSRVRPMDKLKIKTTKAPKVFCVKCRKHVFFLRLPMEKLTLESLVPLTGGPHPPGISCPKCGDTFLAWDDNYGFRLKTNKGLLP